ncbi:glycosyltransferase family 2 protein [Nitratireductor sp. XY-223]|uniref:glycosyltransferase family A protein n=1 Tax=Nitratireductor sp. XY-223 TaxID=2561926 RepID=UPI0010AABC9F|nr:glycosyltransferase family 2 protein [Nitratireductor sp. XY-223]
MNNDYTVLVPAFNAEDTIAEALDSILSQTIPPKRVIVVDDGSTDGTARAVAAYGNQVTLIKQENRGVAAATNVAIRAVKTPLMAALDADDIWHADKMERQLGFLAEHAQLGAVFCRGMTFRDTAGSRIQKGTQDIWGRSGMLIRTAEAVANGALIQPPDGLGDMVDWIARLRENGVKMALLPDVLLMRRIRPGSMTFSRRELGNKGYIFVAREAILRRRAAAKRPG